MLAACQTSTPVTVRVRLPGLDSADAPAAGVTVVALPYDRDSVLASLEARARTPRPATQALDSLYTAFRGPFGDYVRATYDVEQLERAGTPNPAALAAAKARQETARAALDGARKQLDAPIEQLRRALRGWEDTTYAGYDTLTATLTRSRQPVADTTNAQGQATLRAAQDGRWWAYARAWDVNDPNREWYWNVPIAGDSVTLTRANAKHRPRY